LTEIETLARFIEITRLGVYADDIGHLGRPFERVESSTDAIT
jgi:hypothetical protein